MKTKDFHIIKIVGQDKEDVRGANQLIEQFKKNLKKRGIKAEFEQHAYVS